MQQVLQTLRVAVQFLTRLPLRLAAAPTPQQQAQALLWYPLVGALLGVVLSLAALVLTTAPDLLGATLLLVLWAFMTGALHLDGLADSADAWAGGHGDAARSLAIMKDPAAGPAAVVVLVLVLLLKLAALSVLIARSPALIILAPLLARAAVPALFLTTRYVRANGLGAAMAKHLPRRAALLVVAAAAGLVLLAGWSGARALLAAALAFGFVRTLAQRRIGGFTGDVAGALIEIVETAVLLALAM
ncbi:MAG: adenosylcobinamide-GDP ribazoletransferase [Gammaproteobacteria bacterium]